MVRRQVCAVGVPGAMSPRGGRARRLVAVDSSPPSFDVRQRARLRPWYVLVAMLLTGYIGLSGAFDGIQIASLLRGSALPDTASIAERAKDGGDLFHYVWSIGDGAQLQALTEMSNRAFGLSVAQILLFGLLFVASTAAMSGRRGSRALALQAIFAAAAFMAVDYALKRSVRMAGVEAMVRAALPLQPEPPWADPRTLWNIKRTLFAMQLGPLVFAAFALTRPRTKAFFEAVARRAEREDDDE